MGLKEYWQEAEIWSHISPHTYDDVMKISAPYTNRDRQDRPTTLKSIFELLGLKDTNDALMKWDRRSIGKRLKFGHT